ncbi:Photosystem I chlorophyll a apoprotein A1 [Capsicum annuum]|uniref:Photosystem I chlorophyll a apoprotein A1 n=1 Tax=Capsicum annuum TaxID=4072 RepID=A0A2G2Y7T4_CAPAN|nr:Photosystem I chlorophyll a apoprotein A1 [Capsicum annuum]
MSGLYYSDKANVVADGLSRLSMDSVSFVEDSKKKLAQEVYQLARLSVRLVDTDEGDIWVQSSLKSSLVSEVHLCVPGVNDLRQGILAEAHVKIEHQKPSGSMQEFSIPTWKWEVVNIDFMMGLPQTRHQHDSVWVIIWRASGIASELQLYCTKMGALLFAALMLFGGWFHYHKAEPKLSWFQDVESMANHHLAGLLGLGSLFWVGHQVHISLLINQFLNTGVDPKEIPLPHEFFLNRDLLAQLHPSFVEEATPFFTLNWSKYADFFTFHRGLDLVIRGLWLIDIAYHHLAIAILFLIAGHMYKTNWGIGHGLKDILEAHKGPFTGQGHKGLYEILTTSWHAQLSLNLAMLGSLTIVVAHYMYSMPPYPYLATDYCTQLSLFTRHIWIDGFLIVGAAAHASIYMVRYYDPTTWHNNLLDRVLRHRDAIISHLNWACIFLGFHSFGLYIHNHTISALGCPQDMFSNTAIQ